MLKSYLIPELSGLLLLGCVLAQSAAAQSDLQDTRKTLHLWIETEKKLAQVEDEWAREREITNQIIRILENEKKNLAEQIEKDREEVSKADAKREELAGQRENLKTASAVIMKVIADLEAKVHDIYPMFPEPLQQTVDQLYSRMPKKGAKNPAGSLSARMQNVIGILSQVDKFNGSVTLDIRLRELKDGRQVEVKTLYLGLGYAYFIDKAGEYVGYGIPSTEGWIWTEDKSIAPVVAEAVSVYEDPQKAVYVNLPVTIRK